MSHRMLFLVLAALSLWANPSLAAKKFNITIGYLPCLTGGLLSKQGLTISGAVSVALEELNNSADVLPDVDLQLEWHDTKYDSLTTTRLVTEMSCNGVVAFFGPEQHCQTEAVIAQSLNLPMISFKCFDYQTSSLPNFIRLDPSGAEAMKSVISLLRYYRWSKFSIIYDETWKPMAETLAEYAEINNMTLNHQIPVNDTFTCCENKLPCCAPGFWSKLIANTKNATRIYVVLGSVYELTEIMSSMEVHKLFSKGEYMVIFVDLLAYNPKNALKYIIKTEDRYFLAECPDTPEFKNRSKSLLVVVPPEPDSGFDEFADKVRRYNTLEPFNIPDVFGFKYPKFVSIYAAYLYDSVKLYAKALDEIIKEETATKSLTQTKLMSIVTNGTRIVDRMIKSSPFKSISGSTVRLNKDGQAEGDFSVLAFKPAMYRGYDVNCDYSMVPVAQFRSRSGMMPEYKLNPRLPIDWADNVKPDDEPACGFSNTNCN